MKTTASHLTIPGIFLAFILSFSFPLFSHSQTYIGAASTPADGGTQAGPTVAVAPPGGMVAGDLVVIYAHYRATPGTALTMLQTSNQVWATALTGGTSNQNFGIFWCRYNGTWGTNPSVTIGAGTNGMSAIMYVYRPTNSSKGWMVNNSANTPTASNATTAVTITGLTTTAPNTVSMGFWATPATNTWNAALTAGTAAGWIKAGGQQYRNTTTGQSFTGAYKIMAGAGATGDVIQTRSAGTLVTQRTIVAWAEADPPANNLCPNAITLTSATTCVTTAGTLNYSTYTPGGGVPGCGSASPDVWYRFIAQSTNPTITTALTSGTGQRRTELYQGTCGSLTSIICSGDNNNLNATGLNIGQTYYVRVYSNNNSPYAFTICVVDPPANDLCDNAVSLVSGISCSTTAGTLTNATYTADASCGAANLDVWYSFVAQSTNPTITTTLTSGSGQRRTELYSGVCGSLSSITCSGNSNNIAATGLTIGQLYYVRVYSNNTSPYNFTICVTDPATSNNLCGSSILLTSSTSCTPVAGNMYGSTLTTPTTISALDCSGGLATYDLWYRFVAQTTNPTITLNNLGATFASDAHLQLLSNNCGGTFTSFYCGTTSIAADFLTPGTTYMIRVYGTGTVPASPTGNGFDICVTDPVSAPPSNDECTNAVNLSVAFACSSVAGNIAGATASAVPLDGSCAGPLAYDVWYKFTAVNANATATLGSIGTNFLNPRIEMFSSSSGTCATLNSIFCGASPLAATGLTVGETYYVRVYSTTAPAPNGNARFTICLSSSLSPVVRFGNSYVNVSKKTTGGVVEPGDTLEIRMTINHINGTTMSNLRYVDNLPSHTAMLTGTNDSIRVITNEGLMYKKYTPASGDDAASYLASPAAGEYNIRINLGFGTSNPGVPPNNTSTDITNTNGTMTNTNYPRGGGNLLFATAYRVVVTGVIGDTITLNPAQFIYRTGGSDVTLTANSYKILISEPLSLCSNSIGLNNATESGGTFGSGVTLNRPSDLTTPIAGYSFLNDVNGYNGLGDGRYAIVKNISPRSRTNRNAGKVPNCTGVAYGDELNCNNRMHTGHWYIDGDHTGTNDVIGNAPPDATTNAGYMLMVNADYVASNVFAQTLTNLCPNTYYEFSAWVRNICPTCGADSLGLQFQGTPTAPANGYPGVYPNLSFALDGLDYYNTGEIDTVGWLKKGFVFRTGPSQTNATFSIRNNSQGGGGNDWVMDDIAVATCLPTMNYAPTINPIVCETNPFTLSDTISSYFKNYTTYKWQRSTNGGSSWTDVTGVTTLADTNYYITNYTVAPANTTLADSGDLYRVVVATTTANLSDPNCNISDGTTITLNVINCTPVLDIELLYFNGKLINDYANLSWSTSREEKSYTFIIEKSTDQRNFIPIGNLNSNNNPSLEKNYYSFEDPVHINGKVWYRLAITEAGGRKKYSRTISLNKDNKEFDLGNVTNPFDNKLYFEIVTDQNTKIDVYLIDVLGKPVKRKTYMTYAGTNSLSLDNTDLLPAGIYALRIESNGKVISKKVVKKD